MEFSYENQGTNTYLVYEIKPDDQVDTMSLGMLTNNRIPGFARTLFTQMDAQKFIKYNVSAKVSVKQFFGGTVNRKRLLGIFEGIVDALLSADEYMIDVNMVVMDLDYIFADVSTCEPSLICMPLCSDGATDFNAFFKDIMFNTQFDQNENCDYVAKIINFLNGNPTLSLLDFKKLLESCKTETKTVQAGAVKPTVTVHSQPIQPRATVFSSAKAAENKEATPSAVSVNSQPEANTPALQKNKAPAAEAKNEEKKMSMLDLLTHYSKENVEIYKAQKAAEKEKEEAEKPKKESKSKKSKKNANNEIALKFAIPGQDIPMQSTNATYSSQPVAQPAPQPASVQPVVEKKQEPAPQAAPYVPRPVLQQSSANFGDTTVLGGAGIGETTVLGAANAPVQTISPHLIRRKNNEKIQLNKPIFRIGKERSYVDYFIGDNTAISRSHADFVTRNGECFVIDTNSTNHTYINGEMIQSNCEMPISHGDVIRLANEDFDFKLY